MKVPKDVPIAHRATYQDGYEAGYNDRIGNPFDKQIETYQKKLSDPRRTLRQMEENKNIISLLAEKRKYWQAGFVEGASRKMVLKGGV